ncbi:MAG: ABC transporter ATP-binding protein/permease [Defluviitaleaceae bacterium]|nr:ABC transporter ATP-binding protein/permease [Defluviitaleaceae bacterium]
MLQLKGIKKSYQTEDFTQVALDDVHLNFRKKEFVAILGPSGSGKTTCLNILGGLDHYDEGDLIINGQSTKRFNDRDWDAYRNNSVGFVFQNYHLIAHLNLIDNVEMGMTLSGLSFKEKRTKALVALERVGLKDHIHKRPNQLSGGQMQRVAIARALANEPDIILADEPTGALDTATSGQIMALIREIAQEKLVIMVTHNPELAEAYADRIIRFQDGKVIYDSNPTVKVPDVTLTATSGNKLASKTDEQIIELAKRILDYQGGPLVIRLTQNPTLFEHPHDRLIHYDGDPLRDEMYLNLEQLLFKTPDFVLTETPTNQLHLKTDEQIIMLVKEVIDDHDEQLVVRVTKNPTLQIQSDDRLIYFDHGQVFDSVELRRQMAKRLEIKPKRIQEAPEEVSSYQLKRTSMSYLTALKLSGKNIVMKKWRTTLTMLALSIGLIGVAIILALSNGFNRELAYFESETLMDMPISISEEAIDWDQVGLFGADNDVTLESRTSRNVVYVNRPDERAYLHTNRLTDDLLAHLEQLDPADVRSMTHVYHMNLNLLREIDDDIVNVTLGTSTTMAGGAALNLPTLPQPFDEESESLLFRTHELLAGAYPTYKTDLVLIVDEFNRVNANVLEGLGFDTEDLEQLTFEDFVGLELRLLPNDDFYIQTDQGNFVMNPDVEALYESENATTLTIRGVFRQHDEEASMQLFFPGIVHSDELTRYVVAREVDSDIVRAQQEADYNVLTLVTQSEEEQRAMLTALGGRIEPAAIHIFPYPTFEAKDAIMAHLDAFNEEITDDVYRIIYEDQAAVMADVLGEVLTATTLILVAFSAISLVVSLVMIAIITYISVMERTKEIGILRALGARKKDVTRIFIAEVIIIGFLSGVFSITITHLLSIPISHMIYQFIGMENVASLSLAHAFQLVLLSLMLTVFAGFIPARIAAKKDPVAALRTE